MSITKSRLGSRVAVLLAGVLSTAGLAVMTAPAQAADEASLQWKISNQFANFLPVHTLGDGATEDAAKVVSFPRQSGSYNSANGTATVNYSGWVQGAFQNSMCPGNGTAGDTTCYQVRIANPSIAIDASGNGTISADVTSQAFFESGGVPAGATSTQRVLVTTFTATAGDWVGGNPFGSLSRTPAWENVLAPGSAEAVDAGITDPARPYNGASFAQPFIKQLYPSLRAHFHQTSATAQPNKAPAQFVAQAPAMKVTSNVTSANSTTGLTLQVSGTGFRGVTIPGDTGIYVAIAESGGLPDVTSMGGMSNFAASNYVSSAAISSGTFTSSLTAPAAKLDSTKSYSIYTWQAHTHSNVTQDTETPLSIDFAALQSPPVAAVPVAATATSASVVSKRGHLAIVVARTAGGVAPDGLVKVTMTKGKKKRKKTRVVQGTLANGSATLKAAGLSKGKWRATVEYLGSATTHPSATSLVVQVKKR